MSTVSTALRREAESIFTDRGHTVEGNGRELRATRKCRVVRVTPMAEPGDPPQEGSLRCFVTWADSVGELERRLSRADLDYQWAVIGVEDSEHVVSRYPGGTSSHRSACQPRSAVNR